MNYPKKFPETAKPTQLLEHQILSTLLLFLKPEETGSKPAMSRYIGGAIFGSADNH